MRLHLLKECQFDVRPVHIEEIDNNLSKGNIMKACNRGKGSS
jgi:hypothetical protein